MTTTANPVPLAEADLPFIDVNDQQFLADPFPVLSDFRERTSLALSSRGVEVLPYELCAELLNDRRLDVVTWEAFAVKGAPEIMVDYLEKGLLSNIGRERHDRIRRVFVQGFRPGTIQAQRPTMEVIADRLIDDFAAAGRCDVIEQFSGQFSIEVTCALIGIPAEDIPTFAHATKELALIFSNPLDPVRDRLDAALHELQDYSRELVARRRAIPPEERSENFVNLLIGLQEAGEKIEGDELIWGIGNLLFGAMDTTRFQVVGVLKSLIDHGAWEQVAADPELIPGAVEEAIRWAPVVGFVPRRALKDAEIEGVVIPKDTVLMLNVLAANRDPSRFPDPYRFDISRETGQRLLFGRGLHKCLGDRLAWLILEMAVEKFTSRLTDARIVGETILTPRNEQLIGNESFVIEYQQR